MYLPKVIKLMEIEQGLAEFFHSFPEKL